MRSRASGRSGPPGDLLLVSVGLQPRQCPADPGWHRMASRLASRMGGGIRRESGNQPVSGRPARHWSDNLRLAEELEARVATLQGRDTADGSRPAPASTMSPGSSLGSRLTRGGGDKLQLLAHCSTSWFGGSGDVDVYVISGEAEGDVPRRQPALSRLAGAGIPSGRRWW